MDTGPEGPRDRPHGPGATNDLENSAARWAWLAHTLDDELRASLRRALLWTQYLLRDRRKSVGSRPERGRSGPESVEKELSEALALVDDLLVVGCTEWTEGRDPWIRSIVVRDLVEAAARKIALEARARSLEIKTQISPEDLRLVADPDWTLHAVEALLRMGIRSASPGDSVSVEISGSDGTSSSDDGIAGWVTVTLDLPRTSLDTELHLGKVGNGRPWSWPGSPTGALPLSLGAAGCYARLLGGGFNLTEVDASARSRVSIRIPSHRTADRRPGWIP